MAMKVDFSHLTKQLTNLAYTAQDSTINKVLDAGSEIIINEIKDTIVADDIIDTGELLDSIGEIRRTGISVNRKVLIGIKSNDRKVIERGYYQEYGNRHMNGKRYIKKAFNNSIDEAKDAIVDSLLDNLL